MNHTTFVPKKFPGYILALTGPSGVGKSTVRAMLTTVCSEFVENIPIITTRNSKQGDNGEYIHVTQEEFERMKQEGIIVAATQIPSSGENRQYGYRGADIEAAWKRGKMPAVITELHLLEDLASYYGRRSILSFGLLPPGTSKRARLSQLLHRLRSRGRETEEHINDRLKNAEDDMALFTDRKDLFDHVVVNEELPSVIEFMRKEVSAFSKT